MGIKETTIRRDIIRDRIQVDLHKITDDLYKSSVKIYEPDLVANLVLNLTPRLTNILKTVDPTSNYSFTSIFCHQSPKVQIGPKKVCEIGDILIIYVDKHDKNQIKYNSMLLQAKVSNSKSFKCSGTQYDLYNYWPEFEYNSPKSISGKAIDIYPKVHHDGGKYLIIDKNYPISNSFYKTAVSASPITKSKDLSMEIAELITFTSGKMFDSYANRNKDDWTRLIWDMVELSLVNTNLFNVKNTFGSNSRNQTCMAYGVNGEIFSVEDEKLNFRSDSIIDADLGYSFIDGGIDNYGISLMYIERLKLD